MKPKVKKAWVKALTDGSYEKRESDLRLDDRYCVLGVLCDLYAKEHPESRWEKRPNGAYAFYLNADDVGGNTQEPPHEVAEWAGMGDVRGLIHEERIERVAEVLKNVYDDDSGENWTEGQLNLMTISGLSLMRLNDSGIDFPHLARIVDAVF